MHAHKVKVTVPADHRLEIVVPADFPAGPAEVIVLTTASAFEPGSGPGGETLSPAQRGTLAVLDEIRSSKLTDEEEGILDELEAFRRESAVGCVGRTWWTSLRP
jgi:hypothetical protein